MDAEADGSAGTAMAPARPTDAEGHLARFDARPLGIRAFLGDRTIGHLFIERLQVRTLDRFLQLRKVDAKVGGELLEVGLAVFFRGCRESRSDLADLAVAQAEGGGAGVAPTDEEEAAGGD